MSDITTRMAKIPPEMTLREVSEAKERFRKALRIRDTKPDGMSEKEWARLETEIDEAVETHTKKCRDAHWMMLNARYLVVAHNPEMVSAILRVEWFCDPFCMGVAYTNGSQVAVGAAFADFVTKENEPDQRVQTGILAHEMMHIAMGHPSRGEQFMGKHPEVPHFLLNVSADVLINEGLIKNGFRLPKDALKWSDYLKLAPENDPILTKRHSGGEVFEAMALRATQWMKDRLEKKSGGGTKNGEQQGTKKNEDEEVDAQAVTMRVRTGQGSNPVRDSVEEEARRLLSKSDMHDDVRMRTVKRLETERRMCEIRRAFHEGSQMGSSGGQGHGQGLGNTLRELERIDGPPVDWRKELDQIARKTFEPTRETVWGQPSRLTLSQMARAKPGSRIGIRSRRTRKRKPGTLHLGMDTSGSIDDPKLEQFLAHGARIAAQHGAQILFSLSDDDIRASETIETTGKSMGWIHEQFVRIAKDTKGGGGTSFVCVTQLARENDVDATFFYTDLMGTFDSKPPPGQMVWCVHKDEAMHEGYEPPYGRVLRIAV